MAGLMRAAAGAYAAAACAVLTAALLFAGANVLLAGAAGPALRDSGIDSRYCLPELPADIREQVYPGMRAEEVLAMLQESWSISYEYAPYRQFKAKASNGRYTRVDPAGFRCCKEQGPWPPSAENFNVFLFGGSTAYNIGVPECDTIATHLQDALGTSGGKPVRVYNFGCPMFFSSAESVLFERLLVAGQRPDAAVFLDGLNEFYHVADEPGFSEQIGTLFENSSSVPFHLRALVDGLPVIRLMRQRGYFPGAPERVVTEAELKREDVLQGMIGRYLENMRNIEALAQSRQVKVLFVWQPVPVYGYGGSHPFELRGYGKHGRSRYGYAMMAEHVSSHTMPGDFLWLADMQRDLPGMLYVDIVHYSGRMSKEVASRIASGLRDRCGV